MSRNLAARIAVAAVTIPVILWVCYQGGGWLFGMLMLLATLAVIEFLVNEGSPPRSGFFWLGIITVASTFWLATGFAEPRALLAGRAEFLGHEGTPILLFFVITAVLLSIGKQSPADLFRRHSRLVWGVVYIGLLYPFVYKVGEGFDTIAGGDCLLFLFGLLWIGDTAAMGIGSWLGRHKLAPTVSPNKTVEGFIGGLLGALAVGLLMHFWRLPQIGLGHILIIALGCSLFGQLGDLVESMWKRSLGIKDSSRVIPGHGGVLDRFDSLLFAAPFMYFYLRTIGGC